MNIINDIVLFCELQGQKEKIDNRESIELMQNTLNLIIVDYNGDSNLDWNSIINKQRLILKEYGFSSTWVDWLKDSLDVCIDEGLTLQNFCFQFNLSMQHLSELIIKLRNRVDGSVENEALSRILVNDIFDNNDWGQGEREIIEEIRKLKSEFSLMRGWILDYTNAYLKTI